MGQYLSMPLTEKVCESGSNDRLVYGLAAMQGWRLNMEDAHATMLDLDGPGESNAFFGIYDGHGGSSVAKFAAENVHKRLFTEESYKEQNWEVALKKAFLGTDEDFLAKFANPPESDSGQKTSRSESSGCTALAALVTNTNKIYVANAGDSRSVLSVKGKVKALSVDHKPTDISERTRIIAAGGYISESRVNGNLAMSRALGDFSFKQNASLSSEAQVITADPEVRSHEITEEDEFLVLGCDGIWDCLSSQQVVDFVRYQVSEGKELTKVCEMILDHCLAPNSDTGRGCDNMTLLVVGITHGRTKKEWYKWMKQRVNQQYGYKTPERPPVLYSQYQLKAFQERKEAHEARQKMEAKANKQNQVVAKGEDASRSQLFAAATYLSNLVVVAVTYLTSLAGKLWRSDRAAES